MWELVTDATITDDVLAISALSAYVVAAPQKLDALRCAVIWDMFRDFILLVGQHHFLGMQDECLSLATCPLVLEAMSVLMESKKPNIVPYIISSPWTQSLRKYLCDFAPLIRVEERFRKVVTDTLVPLCMSLAQQIQSHIDCASSNEPEATQQKAMKYTSLSHICYFPSGMGPKLMLSR
ncbi:hypothetical protein BDW22DRAFT_112635 [Trametopsis cervina]|nr:hypothetical protein BDW22DRAFT_112635 [Trametopsis cervina]